MIEAFCAADAAGSGPQTRAWADETMDDAKQLFRIVIGAYRGADLAALATRDLHDDGLADSQLCVICASAAALVAGSAPGMEKRLFAGQVVDVTAPDLFDQVWHAQARSPAADPGKTLVPWMTPGQSKAILDSLRSGALVLLVSASSATEQVRASRIQLNHQPSMVQTYSFMA